MGEKRKTIINNAVTKGLDKNVKMKDSGVEWLGEVPKDWNLLKIRNLGNIFGSTVDKKINEDEKLVNLLNYKDVYNYNGINNNFNFMQVTARDQQINKYKVEKGDVFFTPSSETNDDIGHSAVVTEELPNTLFSYHLVKLDFNSSYKISLSYKKYLFNNDFVLNQFSKYSTGITRMILNKNDFKETKALLPPQQTQQKIADYLDKKTQDIDKTVERINQSINLLTEYKSSLISHVVTGKVKI